MNKNFKSKHMEIEPVVNKTSQIKKQLAELQ